MAGHVNPPSDRPESLAEDSVRSPVGASRLPRLTLCSLVLAVPGLLLAVGLVIAAFAVEWGGGSTNTAWMP